MGGIKSKVGQIIERLSRYGELIRVPFWCLEGSASAAADLDLVLGRVGLEGWGQKTALWGFFIDRDPELLFYKKGYEYRSLKNTQRTEIGTSKVRQSA